MSATYLQSTPCLKNWPSLEKEQTLRIRREQRTFYSSMHSFGPIHWIVHNCHEFTGFSPGIIDHHGLDMAQLPLLLGFSLEASTQRSPGYHGNRERSCLPSVARVQRLPWKHCTLTSRSSSTERGRWGRSERYHGNMPPNMGRGSPGSGEGGGGGVGGGGAARKSLGGIEGNYRCL